jgi:2-amino-4-hydroxy-6-hydroxymethyldihydropteridine diphosphokinase
VNAPGGDYINNVISIETQLEPVPLLRLMSVCRHSFGRERPFANAPRTLDIDLLIYKNVTHNTPELVLPHPRITERMFVLLPLPKIDSEIELPQYGKLKEKLPDLSWQRIERLQENHYIPSKTPNKSH